MHRIELEILKLFKREPQQEIATGDIVKGVLGTDFEQLQAPLHTPLTVVESKKAKREKARLHRKVLYHLHKLISDEILIVRRVRDKGEKIFALALESGDYVIERNKRKILISKPANLSLPIEGYEHEKIIVRYDSNSWLTRLNALFVEVPLLRNPEHLHEQLRDCFQVVNDVVGLNRFEHAIDNWDTDQLSNMIKQLELDGEDYHKQICLVISLIKLENDEHLLSFADQLCALQPTHVEVVFNVNYTILKSKSDLLQQLIAKFAEAKVKLNIKNSRIHPGIYLVGRAGTYAMPQEDWSLYLAESRGRSIGASLGQTTLAIDLARFRTKYQGMAAFQECVQKAIKALFQANLEQRQHAEDFFGVLNRLNGDAFHDFFKHSRVYLRLWNYSLKGEEGDQFVGMVEQAQKEVESFCHTQETILKSCGMPIRFRAAIASTFHKFDLEFLSERSYNKSAVRGMRDLLQPETADHLQRRERLFQAMLGGDRLRIHRAGKLDPAQILQEWSYLMSTPYVPLFTYDFRGLSGEVRLTEYL